MSEELPEITDADFKIVFQGLDEITEKYRYAQKREGGPAAFAFFNAISAADPKIAKDMQTEWKKFLSEKAGEGEQIIEEIMLLKAKLVQLKRWISQEAALRGAKDIIEPKKP